MKGEHSRGWEGRFGEGRERAVQAQSGDKDCRAGLSCILIPI